MAEGHILSVRDRAITAVALRLATIQEANGYTFSVVAVHRRARIGFGDMLPEIALYFGHASYRYVSAESDLIRVNLATQIRFAGDWPDDDAIPIDRGYDYFLADIQRCLASHKEEAGQLVPNPILDPWYSEGEIRLWPQGDRIFYVAGSPRIQGVAFYQVEFDHLASDPRRWAGSNRQTGHPGDQMRREDELTDIGEIAA